MDRVEIDCLCAIVALCAVIACAGRVGALPYVVMALVLAKVVLDTRVLPARHRSAAARRAMFEDADDDVTPTEDSEQAVSSQSTEAAPSSVLEQPVRVADPFKLYTIEEQERRRDDFNFRASPSLRQSSDQRTRTLNTMYKELLESSKRGDPYLRPKDATDACRPMRAS